MISNLKPYPAMKASGVEWLGEVPEHWTTERLKSSMNNIVEQTTERQGADIYVALEHVESWTGRLRPAGLDVSFDSQVKCFRSGDVLFGKLRPYLAKVTRPTSDGVCVGEFLVLRPRHSNATAPYMEQLLRSKPIIGAVNSSTFGAKMPRADWRFMGGTAVALPPLPEQAAIVRYLDHADRRIRRYIRAKQKLITLLEEQKQALIHQAVIRGLDPNVRLKPSGVEWLGDVPEHWEVRRLKYAVSFTGGGTPSKAAATFWSGHIPWVSPKDMTRAQLNDTADHITNDAVAASATSIVAPGAVLIVVRSGILRRTIPVAINTVPMALNQDMKALRPKDGIAKSEYLLVLIQGNESFLLREWTKHGATVESIEHGFLANSRVPLPPLPEQAAIVRFLDEAAANIDDTINRSRRQIELLSEYRTRLIADVVTGKLDVREAAASLLEEADERVPLDEGVPLADDVVDNLYHRVGRGAGNGK